MDAFAHGLKIAAAIRKDGVLKDFVKQRYASWDTGIGAEIESGKAKFEELEAYMLKKGDADKNVSGRQEMLERRESVLPVAPKPIHRRGRRERRGRPFQILLCVLCASAVNHTFSPRPHARHSPVALVRRVRRHSMRPDPRCRFSPTCDPRRAPVRHARRREARGDARECNMADRLRQVAAEVAKLDPKPSVP